MSVSTAQQHFDDIAGDYDYWKKKNYYYHNSLKKLFREFIPPASRVWEIGCGTGDILASLEPREGLGEDISFGMIVHAQQKYHIPEINFIARDLRDVHSEQSYDYVVLADVLEHVHQQEEFLIHLHELVRPNAQVVVTLANPLWEPVLMIAEKLHLKMPEGPHERPTNAELSAMFVRSGFQVREFGHRLLVPKPVWGAEWINRRFHSWPVIKKWGFVVYWVLVK